MHKEYSSRVMPLVPLRGLAVFPNMVLHFDAGREKSVAALEDAMLNEKYCLLATQKDASKNEIEPEDVYDIGTMVRIKQILKLPGDSIRVLVEGVVRARVLRYIRTEPFYEVEAVEMESGEPVDELLVEALSRELTEAFERFHRHGGKVSPEVLVSLLSEPDLGKLTDTIAVNVLVNIEDKQEIIACADEVERARLLLKFLQRETEMKKLEAKIKAETQKSIEKGQREYYLREQMRVIRSELGEDDSTQSEAEELRERFSKLNLPDEAREKADKELKRYAALPGGSHEAPMLRNWLDWMLDLPWGKTTEDNFDLKNVRNVLDADHYGLEKVKERVVEHLAVCKLREDTKGSILCLVGPPGVGKTSIASSIARALGKSFVRMSLGGVRDEAEIRGHRRTYIGAIPGRMIGAMKEAGSMNPLILLDEIDKLGADHRGDPASAMLEVLDGAQNSTFRDHYLEVPFDLSRVMFITTANTTSTIPRPLLDRMEVVELSSYTEEEKLEIAMRHLLPKQMKEHALPGKTLSVSREVMADVVTGYTREAGVRTLERRIAALCRKAAMQIVTEERKRVTVTQRNLSKMLGTPRYRREKLSVQERVGVVNGLAWTSVGGEILCVEAMTLIGGGQMRLTGQLGDVMKESAQAAFTYARAHAAQWGIDPQAIEKLDVHVHLPEGAIPKDGPSAGVALATALISVLGNIPVRGDIAMTGEITLRGKVLPIGGLKEKCIAAHREGIKTVILPSENERDLQDVPDMVRSKLKFVFAERVDEVLKTALSFQPAPFIVPSGGEKPEDQNQQAGCVPILPRSDADMGVIRS